MKGYTQGVFDLLHAGHAMYLLKCSEICSQLTVGIISDALATSYKRRPIFSQQERFGHVNELPFVASTLIIETNDVITLIEQGKIDFDSFFWGEEWKSAENLEYEKKLNTLGKKVVWVPRIHSISSGSIISKVKSLSVDVI